MLEIIDTARNYWLANNLYEYDFVLLLPGENIDMNEKIKSAFFTKLNNRKGYIIIGNEAEQLVELYSLYEFSGNIIIGSFDKPYGRKLQNIINNKIASEETIINDIILGAMNGN